MFKTSKIVVFASLILLLLVTYCVYLVLRPLPLPKQPFEFSVQPGSSLRTAARQLHASGLLPNEWTIVWLARLSGKTTQIKAGNYELSSPLSTFALFNMLTKGLVTQGEISIIEGWTFNQFRTAMNSNPKLRHDSKGMTETEILKKLDIPEDHAEGLFFPDTYYFSDGVSDLILLKRAYQTMQKHLNESWNSREADLPLDTPYQALILASIVEKETGQTKDRSLIAGVFINRIRRGMRLQTDPAVIYGMGDKFDGNLRKRDLQTDTPYNTYTRTGLPPTPIALPGAASIQAVLHPAKTSDLYFVARGDGSSVFSDSLIEHNRAVNRYQKKLSR